MIDTNERNFPNIQIDNVSLFVRHSEKEGVPFQIFPRTSSNEKESFIFDQISIKEDMFAESVFGSIEFYDSTYIIDQLNMTSFDDVYFTLDGKEYFFRILDISIDSDLADKHTHGAAGSVNHVTIRFASDEFVYRNFDSFLANNFIGKISKNKTDPMITEVPEGFYPDDYRIAEDTMNGDVGSGNLEVGLVQLLISEQQTTRFSKKPLIADPTHNDIWLKTENFFYPHFKPGNGLRISQIMNYICEYACDAVNKNAVNFFFWEDLDNWNFRSIESLLTKEKSQGVYNLGGDRGSSENYNDSVISLEVISDTSAIKLLDSGALFSEYVLSVPDWGNPYRKFLDTAESIKKTQVTYNYKEDAVKWKHIADHSVITKFVEDLIYKLPEYSTNRISDTQYGFYGNPYNTDKVSWWNFQDFYTNWYLGKKMALSPAKGGESIKDKATLYENKSTTSEPSRTETEYWQSQFDFSELPGCFLSTIYKLIKWELTEARTKYAEAKKLKKMWDVYKTVICCDRFASLGNSDYKTSGFYALVYAADKIYGGDGASMSARNDITGLTYTADPGGIYAYWWKEVELWPRWEIEEIRKDSYEVIEFMDDPKTDKVYPFPFAFISSPNSLRGQYLPGISGMSGGRFFSTEVDTRAYNLNEIMNTVVPVEFEGIDGYSTLMMNPGVSSPLTIADADRKQFTSYPKKYQMMPVGKFRIISPDCPDFSQSGTGITCGMIKANDGGMYYGGKIVHMKTIAADNLELIKGFTLEYRKEWEWDVKKQRSQIFVFESDNTHDGLCTGGC